MLLFTGIGSIATLGIFIVALFTLLEHRRRRIQNSSSDSAPFQEEHYSSNPEGYSKILSKSSIIIVVSTKGVIVHYRSCRSKSKP
jgi:hypothetical protein